MSSKFSNLITRAITGAVFVIVLTAGILFSSWSFALLFLLITLISLNEYFSLLQDAGREVLKITGIAAGVITYCILTAISLQLLDDRWTAAIPALLIIPFVSGLFSRNESPINAVALTTLGIAYLGLPFGLLNQIVNANGFTPEIVLGFIILIWIHDTGSYLAGFFFGKRKLYERISPKKTWEGSFGGLFFTLAAGHFMQNFIALPSRYDWLAICLIIIVFGTLGDLAESMFKRNLGVKDSGTILPGHGGALDRFDSLLFAAPFLFFYFRIRGIC